MDRDTLKPVTAAEAIDRRKKQALQILSDAIADAYNNIAILYPEITTGDIDPNSEMALSDALEKHFDSWLYFNMPED